MRLGVGSLGILRLGGNLPTVGTPAADMAVDALVPLFSWHSPWPGIELSASMELDLYMYATVEVTGEEEDVLLLLAGAA